MKLPTNASQPVIDLLREINETANRERVEDLRDQINDILVDENRCDSMFAMVLVLSGMAIDQPEENCQEIILQSFYTLARQVIYLWEMKQDGNHRRNFQR